MRYNFLVVYDEFYNVETTVPSSDRGGSCDLQSDYFDDTLSHYYSGVAKCE
jgi:hypothetical protein